MSLCRITTRWSGRGLGWTPTALSPARRTWRYPVPTPSWPPSNSDRKWRSWRRSKRNSRYGAEFFVNSVRPFIG